MACIYALAMYLYKRSAMFLQYTLYIKDNETVYGLHVLCSLGYLSIALTATEKLVMATFQIYRTKHNEAAM